MTESINKAELRSKSYVQVVNDFKLKYNIAQNKNVDVGLREIIKNLLTFNPYFRWTASECLAHPIFDDIREKNESKAIQKIKLLVDQDDAFDYANGISQKFQTDDHISSLIAETDLIQ